MRDIVILQNQIVIMKALAHILRNATWNPANGKLADALGERIKITEKKY